MKATAQIFGATATPEKSWAAVFADLVKARLTLLVLLTTAVGFYMGSREPMDYARMFNTLFGTALVAGGAAALNQWQERGLDARMRRTQDRPLPSGRMQPGSVLWFGIGCAMAGLVYLAFAVNGITSLIGAVTLVCYHFVYTPLKQVTWLNTVIGAIPGGLPPMMGWAAARGGLSGAGWMLFAVQAFWQLPHFLSIAWIYRDEYAKAGFKMLPVVDADGHRTGRQAVLHAAALLAASLCVCVFHLAGLLYLIGALALGLAYLWFAAQFARQLRARDATLTLTRARQLFFLSILYLPLLLALMVVDKVK